MMSLVGLGLAELFVLTFISGGAGIPVGIPPEAEDPVMSWAAPDECLFYSTWTGMAKPDAQSENHTERLLAEEEVQQAVAKLDSMLTQLMKRAAMESPEGRELFELVPTWGKLLLTRPTAMYLSKFEMGPAGPELEGALIVRTDAAGAEMVATIKRMLQEMHGLEVSAVKVDGGTYHQVHPDEAAPVVTFGTRGKYFVVGVGDDALTNLFASVKKGTPDWLQKLRTDIPVERMSSVSYVNLQSILDLVVMLSGEEEAKLVMEQIGIDNVVNYASVTGLDKKGFVSRTKISFDGELKGLVAAFDSDPLAAEELKRIPKDASVAVALRLDGAKIFDQYLSLITGFAPVDKDEIDAEIRETEDQIGFKIREELLASLGKTLYVYASPSNGSLLTSWTGVVSIHDRMTLEKVHNAIIKLAKEEAAIDDDVRIKQISFNGDDIYYLVVDDDDVPVSPAWCMTRTEVVFGLFPQAVKAHLARTGQEDSLVTSPELASVLGHDDGALMITYVDTKKMVQLFYPLIQMGLQMVFSEAREEGFDFDASILPSVGALSRHLQPGMVVIRRTEDGFETVAKQTIPGGSIGATAPVMVALLLPAVQSARLAARRAQSMNNLRMMGISMHMHHDTYKGLPASYNTDEAGKPLLSWRVHVLPYIDREDLYEKFKLDEPWDSEHNKKLIPLMPEVYVSPNSRIKEAGKTHYLAVGGEKGIALPPAADQRGKENPIGCRFAQVTDGTSNTAMIVEVSEEAAVTWTKPVDFVPDAMKPTAGLFGMTPGGTQMLMCDGSVHFIPQSIDMKVLMKLFDRADGEVVEFP